MDFDEDNDFSWKCKECPILITTNIEDVIDHIYQHNSTNHFSLDMEKARALRKFFYDNGYISYEMHPIVHDILKDLEKFLGD